MRVAVPIHSSRIRVPPEVYLSYIATEYLKTERGISEPWIKVIDHEMSLSFLNFETKTLPDTRYKIGVLRVKEGQKSEDDIFANGT